MSGHQLAQGVASLGRNGESMLVHMQPREVAGLQAIAMQNGGSLTINPKTGLPEAGWFGDILGAVAPIAMGALLGPAGLGMSALGAGITTGLTGFALSGGNLGKGLMAGLGGYGGSNLAGSLGKVGATPLTTTVASPSTVGSSILEGGAGSFTPGAENVIGNAAKSGLDIGVRDLGNSAMNLSGSVANVANPTYTFGEIGKGAMQVAKDPVAAWKAGQIGMSDALTVASPLMAIQPPAYKAPEDTSYQMKYEGPYTAQDRSPRTPTQAELTQLAAAGSPEYSYFNRSNPYPGFNKAPGYAEGGMLSGGVTDLYGSPDGTKAQDTLAEPYGLGRLNNLASANAMEHAKIGFAGGGAIAFDAGGYVPTVGSPSYGIAPTDLSQVAAISNTGAMASTPSGLSNLLGNAITDPMGRTDGSNQGNMMGILGNLANQATNPSLNMQDYINAAQRTYDPAASIKTGTTPGAIEQAQFTNTNPQQPVARAMGGGLKDGGFVVPADVVSHLGNGSTDAGLAALQKRHGAQPIRGAGDGMSDSIKTTIEGRQPARVANGEAYITPKEVKRSGGAKKFYAMMDKVRKERTGTKKQGKQINPNKYLMA
jgi:hypothetical protein